MIDELTMQQIVACIVAAAQPSRVILFGSHGRGDAGPGSDLDIMVVKPHVPYSWTVISASNVQQVNAANE